MLQLNGNGMAQDHLNEGSGGEMDLISASKQNLSQGHPSADAGADGRVSGGFDPSATDASYDKSSCRSLRQGRNIWINLVYWLNRPFGVLGANFCVSRQALQGAIDGSDVIVGEYQAGEMKSELRAAFDPSGTLFSVDHAQNLGPDGNHHAVFLNHGKDGFQINPRPFDA